MKLIIENIGLLEKAEITLHPLCVIAGENDNGKSTVGKIVYCLVKAINRYREDLQESKEDRIQEKMEELFFSLRRIVGRSDRDGDTWSNLRHLVLDRTGSWEERLEKANEIVDDFGNVDKGNSKDKEEVISISKEIKKIAQESENKKKFIENAFKKVFASEFDSSLLLQGTTEGRIRLVEDKNELINILVKESNVYLQSEVEPLEFKDATFIDSPLILNYHDLLSRSQTLLEVRPRRTSSFALPYTSLHTKDLFDKLRQPTMDDDLFKSNEQQEWTNQLKALIDGEVRYRKNDPNFVFFREDKEISIKNTASGIKVFGLLKILLDNEILTKNTMLILDEPENHLHPKWQLKLAELLVNMATMGIYVMISSHSPYMIEALKRYADRFKDRIDAGFHLAEDRHIEDKDRLSDIFSILSEPFETFRKMDAEDLRNE